ncbi:MAG: hypothetical protein IJE53_02045 [Bacilli bacterium]|nr:hypothetical protein [Bacilli bacterium]
MRFRFYVVDFKKIDLKGITKFCNKYNCSVKMSVKMDSNGIGIKIYDEGRKCSVSIYDVRALDEEDKKMVIGNEYDNEDLIENVYIKCDHELSIDAESSDEIRLIYLFAMYIASCSDLVLLNLSTQQMLIGRDFKKMDKKVLEKWAKQYDIRMKYFFDIKKWSIIQARAFKVPTVLWIILILLAMIAFCIMMAMVFMYDITNPWLLGSPFIVIGAIVVLWVTYNFYSLQTSHKKLSNLYYEYESELCKLWDERMPKKPSGKIVGLKTKIVNILGILILPTLVGGSILLGLNYIVLGFVVILFPWVCLFLIKRYVTDVTEESLTQDIHRWLAECFRKKIPNEIIAANFDLHDLGERKWKIDFVWCDKFDDKNSMWTKNNACLEGRKTFEFEYDACWEEVQEIVIKAIKKYLIENDRAINIRLYKAMTVGFNDGAVFLIYMNGKVVN